jgi:hypothetical protein
MTHAALQTHDRKGLVGMHGIVCDFSDQRDIFIGREARDQVVELENETDVPPAVVGQRPVIERVSS